MLAFSLLLFPLFGLLASARQGRYAHVPVMHQKRQAIHCEQTYGEGSLPCGSPESTNCFNPKHGQTCCAADSGFCDSGKYCAPVAGYCCLEGEDLETCAKNAGFALPASVSNAPSTGAIAIAASTVTDRTITVIPFLRDSTPVPMPMPTPTAAPTPVDLQSGGCSFETSANLTTSTPVPTLIPHTNGTTHPVVQVSFAAEQVGIPTGLIAMIGIAGFLIMFF